MSDLLKYNPIPSMVDELVQHSIDRQVKWVREVLVANGISDTLSDREMAEEANNRGYTLIIHPNKQEIRNADGKTLSIMRYPTHEILDE